MIKIGIKSVVLLILAIVLVAAMIASNVILNKYKTEITLAFTGGGQQAVTNTEERDNALELGGELVEDILADSAVLLKNENGSLPLAKDTKLNLFGWNATDSGFLVTGGGSGGVNINANLKVTLTDALTDAGVAYNQNLIAAYFFVCVAVNESMSRTKNRFLTYILYVWLCLLALPVGAQQRCHLRGTVVDDKGAPIELATVRVEGQAAGSMTNLKGEYAFSFTSGDRPRSNSPIRSSTSSLWRRIFANTASQRSSKFTLMGWCLRRQAGSGNFSSRNVCSTV